MTRGICVFSKKEAEHSMADVPSELSDLGPMDAAFVLLSEASISARTVLPYFSRRSDVPNGCVLGIYSFDRGSLRERFSKLIE